MTRVMVSDVAYMALESVDVDRGVLRSVAITTEGEAKGHGVWLDRDFVEEVVRQGNASKSGIKARFGHPTMSGSALGTFIGRFKNFRVQQRDGAAVAFADLYLSNSAKDAPGGDLYNYVVNLADEDPRAFGASIVFEPGESYFKQGEDADKEWATIKRFRAADLVDDPAANPDGLYSQWTRGTWAAQVSEFLDTHPHVFKLLEENPGVISHFVEAYSQYKERKEMGIPGDEKTEIDAALEAADAAVVEPDDLVADPEEAAPESTPEEPAGEEEGEDIVDPDPEPEAGEDDTEQEAEEGTPEPDGEGGGEEALQDAAPGKLFLDAFGDIGGRWFIEGLSFEQAQARYIEMLKEENAGLKARVSEGGDGEDPLSFSDAPTAPAGDFLQQSTARAKAENISVREAMSAIAKENPALHREYKRSAK
jgi:hypothetical protein